MSVTRQLNVISQMRLDVPHIRLIESGVAGDFDTIVGRGFAGSTGIIIRGFTIAGSAGSAANSLQLVTADGIAVNLNASESGSFLWVPPSRTSELLDGATNGRVEGSFVPSAMNYVGIDFVRELDDSTIDLVKFKDPVTGAEPDRLVPLGNVLNYRIVISTSPFSTMANVIPVAKVAVSSAGAATLITDARQMMFRLGSGGDVPNAHSSYSWPAGRAVGAFTGADKSFTSQKEWVDATMTRLWELGGGEDWFSTTADRNVHMTNYGSPFANGDYFTFDSGTGAASWQGIRFFLSGSTGIYNEVAAGSGIIAAGQCLYVDLDRTQDRLDPGNPLTAAITNISGLGMGSVPGSRWVLAWRVGTSLYMRDWRYPVGTTFVPATNTSMGVVKLNAVSPTPLLPVVVAITTGGGVVVAATSGNTNGGYFVGINAGHGVVGESVGAEAGVYGYGTGDGVKGNGDNYGVFGTGDVGGVLGTGRAGNAPGVVGQGSGTGIGVQGTGGGGAAIGIKGIGGATSGVGVEGVGTAGNAGGVKGTGQGGGTGVAGYGGATGLGVYGEGNDGGGTFHSLGANPGIIGQNIAGGGPGGYFQGDGASSGVRSFGGTTSGKGVEAYGGAPNGVGVWGRGTGNGPGVQGSGQATTSGSGGDFTGGTGGGDGVYGTGKVAGSGVIGTSGATTGDGVVGIALGSGYGIKSAAGPVGANPASEFKFTSAKTGYLFVPVTGLQKTATSGAAALTVAGGALDMAHYLVTDPNGARLVGSIRLPRGATITAIDAHVANNDVFNTYTIGTPSIQRYDYNTGATKMNKTPILAAGTAAVTASAVGFVTMGSPVAVANNVGTVIGESGIIEIDWNLPARAAGHGTCQVAGLLFTYTYTIVDFMA